MLLPLRRAAQAGAYFVHHRIRIRELFCLAHRPVVRNNTQVRAKYRAADRGIEAPGSLLPSIYFHRRDSPPKRFASLQYVPILEDCLT